MRDAEASKLILSILARAIEERVTEAGWARPLRRAAMWARLRWHATRAVIFAAAFAALRMIVGEGWAVLLLMAPYISLAVVALAYEIRARKG